MRKSVTSFQKLFLRNSLSNTFKDISGIRLAIFNILLIAQCLILHIEKINEMLLSMFELLHQNHEMIFNSVLAATLSQLRIY